MNDNPTRPFATRRQLLGLAAGIVGAIVLAVIFWLTWPVPEHVRRDREKLASQAQLCLGRAKDGTPCLQRTRHVSRYCPDHRPPVWDPRKMIPPVGQGPVIAKPSPLERVME